MSENTDRYKYMKVEINDTWQKILKTSIGVLGEGQQVIVGNAVRQYLTNHPDMAPFVKLALKKKGQ